MEPTADEADIAVALIKKNISPKMELNIDGGLYSETWRTNCVCDYLNGTRQTGTAIYYLLERKSYSVFHKLLSDEIWFWHKGSTVKIHTISEDGVYKVLLLGDMLCDQTVSFQALVPHNTWFAAELQDKNSYGLVSTVVSPGYEEKDCVIGNKQQLKSDFPHLDAIIERLGK